jgi:CRP-like cAMP-binding protein
MTPAGTARPPEKCRDCVLRGFSVFKENSEQERTAVERARLSVRLYGPRSHLYLPGDPPGELYTLYTGWAFSYQTLADGRRHILSMHLPGDTVGLQPELTAPMTHGVETLTDVAVCVFDHRGLQEAASAHWRLAWDLSCIAASEQLLLYEHLTNIGRRTAAERLGFLYLEVFLRAEQRGMTEGESCPFPINQAELGDALGLSTVHVSRMVQELRERGVATVARGRLTIPDRAALAEMCKFQDRFLLHRPLL